jgi:hypothetical protein
MPQDCPDYPQAEADRLALEGDRWLAEKARKASKPVAVCTCRNSVFDLDINRCPVHGIGCT